MKKYIIKNITTEKYYEGLWHSRFENNFSKYIYNAEFYDSIEDCESVIKGFESGFYQIIEVYKID